MGVLSVSLSGSFDRPRADESDRFSAREHGHVHAARKAIGYIKNSVLPLAVAQDARLRRKGHLPAQGFTPADERWLDAHDAREPGSAIPSMEEILRGVGSEVDGALPPGWVFVLVAASVGDSGAMTYLSNGHRDGMIATLRETLARLERGDMGTVGKPVDTSEGGEVST